MKTSTQQLSVATLVVAVMALMYGNAHAQLQGYDPKFGAGPQPEPPSVPRAQADLKDAVTRTAQAANTCYTAANQWNAYAQQMVWISQPARATAQFYAQAGSYYSACANILAGALQALGKGDLDRTYELVKTAKVYSQYADQWLTHALGTAPFQTSLDRQADDCGELAMSAISRAGVSIELLV